jgi:non-canonical purine NTP pyrophosphatase (RdgB/HAM1 family)
MKELTFITSHPKKAEEIGRFLSYPCIHHNLDLPEVQSLNSLEVVEAKAREAYRLLKRPVLVEDYSLRFEALGKLPGPLIKWFLEELQPGGLCKLLDGYTSRRAYAQTCFALCDDTGVHVFNGTIRGIISSDPRGEYGYGTDSIFIPDGQHKTWSEMNDKEQVIYSLRQIGLKKIQAYLQEHYQPSGTYSTSSESNPRQ